MKYAKAVAFVTALFVAIPIYTLSLAFAGTSQTLTFTGLGPVRIGMTLAEAETALHTKLKSVYPNPSETCWFGNRADGIDGPISYWIENGKIVRVDIDDHEWPKEGTIVPSVATQEGIRIGLSTDDVKKAYGSRLKIDFHPQGNYGDENDLYIRLLSDDKTRGFLFEIWEGKVKSFAAGTAEFFDVEEPCD